MTVRYTGGCQCGAIRYEASANVVVAIHCYCRQCQRLTGAGHASQFALPKDAVRIVGQPREYQLTADSGNAVVSASCPTCGSPVLKRSAGAPQLVFFHASTLDDPSLFKPQRVVYAESRQPWDAADADLQVDAG